MKAFKLVAGIAVASMASVALAGGSHVETGDAGSFTFDAQTTGSGILSHILGGTGGADFIDVYMINIVDPIAFLASTAGDQLGDPSMGTADYDTKLWLFDADAFGVLSNDDLGGSPFHSHMTGMATDGTGVSVKAGIHYIAVGGFGDEALSDLGLIFDNASFDEISGPDGPGGGSPLTGWEFDGAQGTYDLYLEGVEGIPAPGALALLGVAGLAGFGRRRK